MSNTMRTINVVDMGADNSGREPINDILDDFNAPNVRFKFPSGRYKLERPFKASNWEHLEIRGDNATFVPTDDFEDPCLNLGFGGKPGEMLRVSGINFDLSADGIGQAPLWALADGMTIKDITVNGQRSPGYDLSTFIFGVMSATGTGLVENVNLPDGGAFMDRDELMSEYIGFNVVRDKHKGILTFRDCYVNSVPNNPFYCYRHTTGGEVHLERCVAENSGLNYFRLDRGDSATACKALIDMDTQPYDGARAFWPQGGGEYNNCRVIRKSGENKLLGDTRGDDTVYYNNVIVDDWGNGDIMDWRSEGGKVVINGGVFEDHNNDDPDEDGVDNEEDYFSSRIKRDSVEVDGLTYRTHHDNRYGIYFEDCDDIYVRGDFEVAGDVALAFRGCGKRIKRHDWNNYHGAEVRDRD